MKPDPSSSAQRCVPSRAIAVAAALVLAAGCGAGNDDAGRENSTPAAGPNGAAGAAAPAGSSEDTREVADAGLPVAVGDALPTMEELEAALDAVPKGLELGIDEALREPGDPADWAPVATVGGEPVETLREHHPTTGVLMRIATARANVGGASGSPALHGLEWRYHETGSQRSVQWWRDDVPHGPLRQWRRVGMLAREGRFDGGQRDGLWRQYSKNEKLLERSIYRRGALVGERRTWFASGQANELENYRAGRLHGRRKVWSREGVIVLDESYADGELHGRWSDFHVSGGDPRQWGHYEHGQRTGKWQRGSAGGVVLSSVEYEAGVLNGPGRVWNEDGVLIEEYVYVHGAKTGPSRTLFADGSPQSEGLLENGRRTGRWTYWKSDGTVNERWSGLYEDDLRVAGR